MNDETAASTHDRPGTGTSGTAAEHSPAGARTHPVPGPGGDPGPQPDPGTQPGSSPQRGPGPDPGRPNADSPDIRGRDDLELLLRRFYVAVFADPLIGEYFTRIAETDLEQHIPRITDFWERALFRTATYHGDAFAVHRILHHAQPLTAAHFGRWVQLWRATIDGLHRGPYAERAKSQGEHIARAMLRRLAGPGAAAEPGPSGFLPLSALLLREGIPAG